jgi:hypothetical protein
MSVREHIKKYVATTSFGKEEEKENKMQEGHRIRKQKPGKHSSNGVTPAGSTRPLLAEPAAPVPPARPCS